MSRETADEDGSQLDLRYDQTKLRSKQKSENKKKKIHKLIFFDEVSVKAEISKLFAKAAKTFYYTYFSLKIDSLQTGIYST